MLRSQSLEYGGKACSRCDNGGSGEHLEHVAGEWLCEGCLALAIKSAKQKILWSRRVVAGVFLLGIAFGIFVATTAPNRQSAGLGIWLFFSLGWLGNVYYRDPLAPLPGQTGVTHCSGNFYATISSNWNAEHNRHVRLGGRSFRWAGLPPHGSSFGENQLCSNVQREYEIT
jgi:hypothetical protein